MFQDYQDIFNKRGDSYHLAMQEEPLARVNEFKLVLDRIQLNDGDVLCDIPSGGGYIRNFIDNDKANVIAIETSDAFFNFCEDSETFKRHLCELTALPIEHETVDYAVSIAGIHHVEDKHPVFCEIYRTLKSKGQFLLADVHEGSCIDDFLDSFVHENSSMGHEGMFVNDDLRADIVKAGFEIVHDQAHKYTWHFDNVDDMVRYCSLLFGIDKATPEQVLAGIEKHLGFEKRDDKVFMNWQLSLLVCDKK